MLKLARIIEALTDPEDRKAVVYDAYRTYGGPLSDAERASRYRDRDRHEKVTEHRDDRVTQDAHLDIDALVVSRTSKTKKLEQEHLDKAKAVLDARDFEFLQSCPEPFKTAWLINADWWVSLCDGYPKVNAQEQASRYMAWPGAARKRDHRMAFRNWVATAERWRERAEQRTAVRR